MTLDGAGYRYMSFALKTPHLKRLNLTVEVSNWCVHETSVINMSDYR